MLFLQVGDHKVRKRFILAILAVSLFAALIVCAVNGSYLIEFIKDLIYLKYLPKLGGDTTFLILLFFGLLTSFHCVGMCGGILLTQTIKRESRENMPLSHKEILRPTALYNTGRVLSYTLIGALVGGIGQLLSLSDFLKGIIPIIGGLFMLVMAVNLLGIFPVLRRIQFSLPKPLVKKLRMSGNKSPLMVGLLTGLMPCGPMQIVQIYALGTRSIVFGAASMFVFALGTVPCLFTFGALSTLLTKKSSKIILNVSAVIVAALGIAMICRGLSLEGVALPSLSSVQGSAGGYTRAVVKNGVQTVTIEIGEDHFTPIEVVKGIPVHWIIRVKSDVLCDCNNEIVSRAFDIDKKFSIGDNEVDFTPQKTGVFAYTCWMGMIKSSIRVVQNNDQ